MKAWLGKHGDLVYCLLMGVAVIIVTWGLERLMGLFVREMKPTMFNAVMIVPGLILWGAYNQKGNAASKLVRPLLPRATSICVVCFFISSLFVLSSMRLPMFGLTTFFAFKSLIPIGFAMKAAKDNEVAL